MRKKVCLLLLLAMLLALALSGCRGGNELPDGMDGEDKGLERGTCRHVAADERRI